MSQDTDRNSRGKPASLRLQHFENLCVADEALLLRSHFLRPFLGACVYLRRALFFDCKDDVAILPVASFLVRDYDADICSSHKCKSSLDSQVTINTIIVCHIGHLNGKSTSNEIKPFPHVFVLRAY